MKENDKYVEKNIGLAFDFLISQVEEPTIDIPDHANVIMLPSDDAEMTAVNREVGKEIIQRGEQVIYLNASKSTPTTDEYDTFTPIQEKPLKDPPTIKP